MKPNAGPDRAKRSGGRPQPARRPALVVTLLLALATPAAAVQPDEILPDPALEARARALSAELRCMVCQNQSIDDSDAPLARDLRLLVRERLKAGESDAQVRDFLVVRYGDFVLLKPPFAWRTALLWGLPFAALGLGVVAIVLAGRRASTPVPVPLTAAEQRRLAELIDGEPPADVTKN